MMSIVLNADPHGKIALQGYDPVAFHNEKKAQKGNPYIATEHKGYKFLFTSEENKLSFEKDASSYLPAFGGYCAYGVSLGVLFPVETDTWEIIDGQLVLQYNGEIKNLFEENKEENLMKARENWQRMEKELL